MESPEMPNYLQNYNTKKRVGYLPFYEGSITGIRPGKKFYPEIVCGLSHEFPTNLGGRKEYSPIAKKSPFVQNSSSHPLDERSRTNIKLHRRFKTVNLYERKLRDTKDNHVANCKYKLVNNIDTKCLKYVNKIKTLDPTMTTANDLKHFTDFNIKEAAVPTSKQNYIIPQKPMGIYNCLTHQVDKRVVPPVTLEKFSPFKDNYYKILQSPKAFHKKLGMFTYFTNEGQPTIQNKMVEKQMMMRTQQSALTNLGQRNTFGRHTDRNLQTITCLHNESLNKDEKEFENISLMLRIPTNTGERRLTEMTSTSKRSEVRSGRGVNAKPDTPQFSRLSQSLVMDQDPMDNKTRSTQFNMSSTIRSSLSKSKVEKGDEIIKEDVPNEEQIEERLHPNYITTSTKYSDILDKSRGFKRNMRYLSCPMSPSRSPKLQNSIFEMNYIMAPLLKSTSPKRYNVKKMSSILNVNTESSHMTNIDQFEQRNGIGRYSPKSPYKISIK